MRLKNSVVLMVAVAIGAACSGPKSKKISGSNAKIQAEAKRLNLDPSLFINENAVQIDDQIFETKSLSRVENAKNGNRSMAAARFA